MKKNYSITKDQLSEIEKGFIITGNQPTRKQRRNAKNNNKRK